MREIAGLAQTCGLSDGDLIDMYRLVRKEESQR